MANFQVLWYLGCCLLEEEKVDDVIRSEGDKAGSFLAVVLLLLCMCEEKREREGERNVGCVCCWASAALRPVISVFSNTVL